MNTKQVLLGEKSANKEQRAHRLRVNPQRGEKPLRPGCGGCGDGPAPRSGRRKTCGDLCVPLTPVTPSYSGPNVSAPRGQKSLLGKKDPGLPARSGDGRPILLLAGNRALGREVEKSAPSGGRIAESQPAGREGTIAVVLTARELGFELSGPASVPGGTSRPR